MALPRAAVVVVCLAMIPLPIAARSGDGVTWVPVGPMSGSVQNIHEDPSGSQHIFAVAGQAESGAFRTSDGGNSWKAIREGIDFERYVFAYQLAQDRQRPKRLFLAVGNNTGRLYRSLDGGETWQPRGVETARVNAVDVDPSNGDRILYGTWSAGAGDLYLSVDGGTNFLKVTPSGLTGVWSVLFDPHDGNFVYCGDGNGLWRSEDGGWTWARLDSTDRTVAHLSADPVTAGTIYLSTYSQGLWRSRDRGETLQDILGNLTRSRQYSRVAPDPVIPDRLWVGSADGVFVTEDGGLLWEERNHGLDSDLGRPVDYINVVLTDREISNRVWAGGDSGLFTTEDGGGSWHRIGVPARHAQELSATPDEPGQVMVGTDWGLYHPGGEGGYVPGPECVSDSGHRVHALETGPDGRVLDGISTSFLDAALIRTTDGCREGGDTEMVLFVPGGDSVSAVGFGPAGSGIVLAGISYPPAGGAAIFRSANGGAPGSFLPIPSTASFGNMAGFAWEPGSATDALALSGGGGVFATGSGGLSWSVLREGTGTPHYQIIYQPDNPSVVYVAKEGGIERSGDGGVTWSLHALAGEDVTSIAIPVNDPDVMFAAVRRTGVLRSEDRGNNWEPLGDGPDHRNILDMEFRAETDRLFAGTRGGGVYLLEGAGRIGPDLDLDAVPDGTDNCPRTANPGQEDADADTAGDVCDCAPSDPGARSIPSEVSSLHAGKETTGTFLTWNDPRPSAGEATTSDLATGDLDQLRNSGSFDSAECLASGLSEPSYQDMRPDPSPGAGLYYLARAVNVCGAGTWGDSGVVPDPRDDLDAHGPCP